MTKNKSRDQIKEANTEQALLTVELANSGRSVVSAENQTA